MYRFDAVDLELSEHNTTQLAVYDICNKAFGRRHAWLAFIDVDEFLVRDVRDPGPDPDPNPNLVSICTCGLSHCLEAGRTLASPNSSVAGWPAV